MPILELKDVSKRYGALTVTDQVSLSLADGEALGIVWKRAVTMAVKMPGAVVGAIPNSHSVVAQDDPFALDFDFSGDANWSFRPR